ncbi:MAG: hypothetical protein ACO1OB_01825 [Archangium sp.]
MRTTLLLSALLFVACGRDVADQFDENGNLVEKQQTQTTALVGTYEFGNIVQQGFAGTPGRLATMRVNADGTIGMSYFLGCLGSGSEGSWSQHSNALDVSLSARGGWVDAEGNYLDVTSLRVTPAILGVTVTGTTADGTVFTQAWAAK